ncbi:hypothetical protein [Rubritalea sp.]|uniref:hypothetical protein n=1 Tax=Rubritalea sp. TaxID=2109375 RepID=UPI003EFA5FFD
MRERYIRMTGRRAKTKLLDEFVEVTGWERKHANKVILGQKRMSERGAPAQYNGAAIEALKSCWLVMDQPCAKRMKDMLLIWVSYLEVSDEVQQQLKTISAASIDRSLKNSKVTPGKKSEPTKTSLRSQKSGRSSGGKLVHL